MYQKMLNVGGGGGASSADKVSYDNTQSGLTETNVQGAIDELNSNLEALATKEILKSDYHTSGAQNYSSYMNKDVLINPTPLLLDKGIYIVNVNVYLNSTVTFVRLHKSQTEILYTANPWKRAASDGRPICYATTFLEIEEDNTPIYSTLYTGTESGSQSLTVYDYVVSALKIN